VTAVVTNDGPAAETQPVQFTVDDEPVSTQTVPLDPDESTDVAFTYGIGVEEPGDRDIEVSVAGSTAEGSTAEAIISVPEPATFLIDEIRAPSEVQQGATTQGSGPDHEHRRRCRQTADLDGDRRTDDRDEAGTDQRRSKPNRPTVGTDGRGRLRRSNDYGTDPRRRRDGHRRGRRAPTTLTVVPGRGLTTARRRLSPFEAPAER
jgi:hypothetical protein